MKRMIFLIAVVVAVTGLSGGNSAFATRDPAKQGMNLYEYAGNNPVHYRDPLGLEFNTEATTYITQALELGRPTEEIAQVLGWTIEMTAKAMVTVAITRAADQMLRNAQRNAKSPDACEAAKDTLAQLQKSLKSFQEVINEHQGNINDPANNMEWGNPNDPIDVSHAVGTWQKHITKAEFNIKAGQKAISAAQKLVDVLCVPCKTWYNPFTWF